MAQALHRILSLILLTTLLGLAGFFLVLYKLDPYETPKLALPFFFVSAFFAFTGSFTLLLFFLKKWKAKEPLGLRHILVSLRQGLLLSFFTGICLSLLMMGLLRVWNGLIIVSVMMLIEFYLSGRDESN
ncbi:hypothetical protein A3J23_00460 [Candidatus Peregrinibacteria bacterium RIFCSPLOWO2_02_FULL_48_14]|nr:MAG: hypothetical protein A3J23_00460 [Candidatus Peregrinibacteria bacterium RIFCSPLOWO2_02_FULL_48_14]